MTNHPFPPVPVLPPDSQISGYTYSPPDILTPVCRFHADLEAQDLVYDAWEAPTTAMKVRILRRALSIFPFCVDALNTWAQLYYFQDNGKNDLDKAEQTYKLAAHAADVVWPGLKDQESIEWGFLDHRPFLRAYHGLGVVQQLQGKNQDAAEIYRFLLRVNPNDNQGARMLLYYTLLDLGEMSEAEAVAEKHANGRKSSIASFQWGFVLIDYSKYTAGTCSKDELVKTLEGAMQHNSYVPSLLLGDVPLPKLPSYTSPGSMDEAVSIVHSMKGPYERTTGIMDWLREEMNQSRFLRFGQRFIQFLSPLWFVAIIGCLFIVRFATSTS